MSEEIKTIDENAARLVVGIGRHSVQKMAEGLYSMVKYELEPEKGLQLIGDASTEDKLFYMTEATNAFGDVVNRLVKDTNNVEEEK